MAVMVEDADDPGEDDDGPSPLSGVRLSPDVHGSIADSFLIPKLIGLELAESTLPSILPNLSVPRWQSAMSKLNIVNSSLSKMALSNLDSIKIGRGADFVSSILGDVGKKSLLGITPGMDSLFSRIIPTFDFLKGLDLDLTRGAWPANLEHFKLGQDILYRLTVNEGLPIAWVPRAETMKLIFEAETPAQRRTIYGRRWRGIIEDCKELADKMDSAWLAPYMRYLHEVIDSMRGGHYLAAQALAASTLDTVAFYLANSVLRDARKPEKFTDPGKLPVRTYFAWSQLAGVYKRFFRENNDPIPATFNRHGASHGVSYRQYSRLNATLGMAHLTSLMWIIDSETRHLNKRKPGSPAKPEG